MSHSPSIAAGPEFMSQPDEADDLPRTFRREKEARAREAAERAAQERAAAPSLPIGTEDRPMPAPQVYASNSHAPDLDDAPYPATVRRIDVPFLQLVVFFLKAVIAAIPALFVLGVILWFAGGLLQWLYPELIRMKILIAFPN